MTTIADLMTPAPTQWGLRGDPLVWEALKRVFAERTLPKDEAALRRAFAIGFETLVQHDLEDLPDVHPVSWSEQPNGGMSNGRISGPFWREKGLPLILSRYRAATR